MQSTLYGSKKASKGSSYAKTMARGNIENGLSVPQTGPSMATTIGLPSKGGDERTVKFVGEPPAAVKSVKDFDFKREK